jgi:hypothetical protein
MQANGNDEIIEVLRSEFDKHFTTGFWVGAISGVLGATGLFYIIGYSFS